MRTPSLTLMLMLVPMLSLGQVECEEEVDEFTDAKEVRCGLVSIEVEDSMSPAQGGAVYSDGILGFGVQTEIEVRNTVDFAMANTADFIVGDWKGEQKIEVELQGTGPVTIFVTVDNSFAQRIIRADRFKMRVEGIVFDLSPLSPAFKELMQRIPE